jgi:hypothetical protein
MSATILDRAVWEARRAAHEARVDGWIEPHLARRRIGATHPAEDFLFTYYSYRPAQLRRSHPGADMVLADADAGEFGREYAATPDGVGVDVAAAVERRRDWLVPARALLAATAARPAQLGCFGLHEWAMVYRQSQDEVRHSAWPLRLAPEATADLVERSRVVCTHFDAFRFFTPAARPLNLVQPTAEDRAEHEQPGCLHANMDLYRWAYRLAPLAPSELVADCFALAREIRTLDMRASPYDLSALGLTPVPVETAEGRAEYAAAQRDFAELAADLRARLLDLVDTCLGGCDGRTAARVA